MYFDFARLSFHVPIRGLLCASPTSGTAVASTAAKKSGAVDVNVSIVRRFIMCLLWLAGNAQEARPRPDEPLVNMQGSVSGHLLDTPSIIHLNEREQKTLSVLLNVRRDAVRNWRSGRNPIHPKIWADLLSLIVDQQIALNRVEQEVRELLARQHIGEQP